jgi:serine/threonine protein kinase/tetratricopeptide (TPR) repeat protein
MSVDPRRLKELFLAATQMPDRAQREAWLIQQCGQERDLLAKVQALLQARDNPESFPDSLAPPAPLPHQQATQPPRPAPAAAIDPPVAEDPGSAIGPYKLLQQIGEGGMGAVYLAEQVAPVKRRVALKLVKAGMDSARVIARFEQERQALALMDHPHIAKVLDGGTTESGRPYFVMELVKGIPITKFCDQEHLTPKERLELFIPVCQAVQHAHQKGIIHRDLKPSNVLIALYDGKPVPKVIDFGLAKAMGQKLTDRTMFTEVGQVVGTLEYMAPEQAELNNLDIDTRADIYSLGVLLYELLTGSPPFTAKQLRSLAFDEMLRVIRECEPPRPSTKLSSSAELPAIAAKRKLEPAKLAKVLRGDLDWIMLKCLEKERARRYETANGLAMDVQRYLVDEPVLASPPSRRYRLNKFLRKHRGPVLAAGLIVLLLAGGIVGTSLGFLQAERQRVLAEQREREALDEKARAEASQRQAIEALQATTDAVVEQLIAAKPQVSQVERQFLETTLQRWQAFAAERGEGELARSVRAEGAFHVAYLRARLGLREQAVEGGREAIALLEKLVADFPTVPRHRRGLAQSHNNLGTVLQELGRHAEAEAAHRRALTLQDGLAVEFPGVPEYRADLADSHNNLGNLYLSLGKLAGAEAAYQRAVHLKEELTTEFPTVPRYRADLAQAHGNLGVCLWRLGKHVEAEAAFRRAVTLLAEFPAVPKYCNLLAISHSNLGALLRELGRRAEAEVALRQAVTVADKLAAEFPAVPEYRFHLATNHGSLGILLTELGRWDLAEEQHRAALAIRERLREESPGLEAYICAVAGTYIDLADLLRDRGQTTEALAQYGRAQPLLEGLLAREPRLTRERYYLRYVHSGRAETLDRLGRRAEAGPEWGRAAELERQVPDRQYFRLRQALSLADLSRALTEARALATSKGVVGPTLYNAARSSAAAASAPGDPQLAGALAAESLALLRRAGQLGYFKDPSNLKHLKDESEWNTLRSRSEFQDLLKELEPPADEKPGGQ